MVCEDASAVKGPSVCFDTVVLVLVLLKLLLILPFFIIAMTCVFLGGWPSVQHLATICDGNRRCRVS
jgi:hypothetical protein